MAFLQELKVEIVTIGALSMKPEPTPAKDKLIGETIAQYKIIRELGEGGMGKVYLAEDVKLGRETALKFVLPQYTSDPKLKAQFEQEARITAALNHPNIVTIYEFEEYWLDENINGYYIAMEYVKGQSLKDLIKSFIDKKEHLRFDQIFDFVIQISKGLLAAHKKNIIHRDLKPGNILVSHEGTAKISDFGLAKLTDDTSGSLRSIPLGTVPYMSPEQARMEKLDQCSDIFSLGVVFYELITLKRPFEGNSLEDILAAIKNKKPELLTRHRPDASDVLQRIVGKALNKSRSRRYQTVNALIVELERASNEFLKTQSLRPVPPIKKNKWREAITNLWRKSLSYQKEFAILGIFLTIISFIADVCGIRAYIEAKSTASNISIATAPRDAEVVLNGKFIGKTPIPDTSMQAGKVSLKISKLGYVSIDTSITVEKGINWMLMFTLKKTPDPLPDFGSIQITSQPPAAAVFLNGDSIGVTSVSFPSRDSGMIKLRLLKADYFPVDTVMAIRRGQNSKFSFVLRPAAIVSIKVNVTGARFQLNGKFIPRSRLLNITLPVGPHRLSISAEGYTPITEQFNLIPGRNPELTYTLNKIVAPPPSQPVEESIAGASEPPVREQTPPGDTKPMVLFGTLRVLVLPFGSIYIDGVLQKSGTDRQFITKLKTGAYFLKVDHPQFGTWEKKIILEVENPQDLTIDFNKNFKLTVTSTPVLGKIFVDDKDKGYAPKELSLKTGKHRIEVRLDGYESEPQVINLDSDAKTPLQFVLKKTD